jgi:NTE family protein
MLIASDGGQHGWYRKVRITSARRRRAWRLRTRRGEGALQGSEVLARSYCRGFYWSGDGSPARTPQKAHGTPRRARSLLGEGHGAGALFPDLVRPYASFLGNPNFFTPRRDYLSFFNWTYFYETEPLRHTLQELIDLNALRDKTAFPRLLVSATNLTEGQIEYFYSDSPDYELTLDHIMASGSLPPAFDMTTIGKKNYWDGGLFDNTPLGAVLDHLNDAPDVDRTVYVVNLFPNKAAVPKNMPEVAARMKNLQFANKSLEDVKLLKRFNEVAALMQALGSLPNGNPLEDHPAYRAVKDRGYLRVPRIVSIIPPEATTQFGDADFSPEAINERADRGEEQTLKALEQLSKSSTPAALDRP